MTIAVLGGGLGGLSATFYLLTKHPKQAVTLIEASNRLGGWIKSTILEGNIIFEQGPRTIRPFGPSATETLALVEQLGLDHEVVPIDSQHPAAKYRMIYANGKLHVLPNSFLSLFKKQEPFSKPLIRLLANDLFTSKGNLKDESIYNFAQRRFGNEIADYLISPIICGICAGNSKEISVNFLLKKFFEYEQKYGSISKGMLRNIFNNANKAETKTCKLLERAKKEKWNVYSFKNGIETLTRGLENNIRAKNVNLELGSRVTELEVFPDNVMIQLDNGKYISSNHVISSLPAKLLGTMLEKQHPELAEALSKIKSVTVAVVNLQYGKKLNIKEGFGFLVAPKEKVPILGVTFDSCCFPRNNNTVLTVMLGGAWYEELFGKNPDENLILNTAKEQLKNILGVHEEPNIAKVNILKNCIPQYVVGHNENVQKIDDYIRKHEIPIALCGSSFYGVSVSDVVLSAKKAVDLL